ncbi:MAG: GntP family permease [Acholeplasmatales bacterium]|nr:MAG: GntP family permease [Acholeplasmatales bacterium]
MFGFIIFILGLMILMVLIYTGHSLIIWVPVVLFGMLVLSGEGRGLLVYAKAYLSGMATFITTNALLFYLGVLMGAYTAQSGLARALAEQLIAWLGTKRTVLALVLLVSVLTFGGISGFVVIFTVYPVIDQAFYRLGIPKRFVFGIIAVGMASHMIGAMPGTLQIQNIIPTATLHTDLYAGWRLGLIMSAYLFISGQSYLQWRIRQSTPQPDAVETVLPPQPASERPRGLFLPLGVILVGNFLVSRYGMVHVPIATASRTLYALNIALVLGILTLIILSRKPLDHIDILKASAKTTLKPLLFVGTTVGFGSALSLLPALAGTQQTLLAMNPLVGLPLTVAVFAGISGSATGGLSIAYPFLGEGLLLKIDSMGVAPEVLHRLSVMASVTLDTLPTNGTTMTMLKVTGLDYRAIYRDYFVLTVLNTSIALMLAITLAWFGVV